MSKRPDTKGFFLRSTTALLLATLVVPLASAETDRDVAAAKKKAKPGATKVKAPASRAGTKASVGGTSRGGGQALDLERRKSVLPTSRALRSTVKEKSLGAVKPPRSGDFYESGSKEAEYEKLVDEEIKTLFKLSQQNRRSQNRGELWLRLGERYVEKARLVEFREQAEYDKKLKDFAEKRSRVRPRIDQKLSREYNQKAVQLYEWFIKDFPQDPKVDQALFFLGYNQFELGNTELGEKYYTDLVTRFPDSTFVTESHFALGEFYFENEKWQRALDNYAKVIKVKNARLNGFALFKASWCLYRLNRVPDALKALERVVRLSRAAESQEQNSAMRRAVNKGRLVSEALKDYVPFYAEVGDPDTANKEFNRVAQDEKTATQMLERLAFIYADAGNRNSAKQIFKQLISLDPGGDRSAEYQYQIVLAYATYDQKEFRKELEVWLESFGPNSFWARENSKNEKLVGDVAKLQETTLRNHVLQLHQSAQNSRAPYSQQLANGAYNQYLKHFPSSSHIVEMQFFHAELLFDMRKYEDAARLYTWVADKDSEKGQYRERAIVNSLLALEKDLPSPNDIDSKRGDSIEKIPLDPPVQRFEKAAIRYMQVFPKGEKTPDIQRRLGVLYYSYNHFDEAIELFERIIRENPKSQNAEIAGNLILDVYKLKGDMSGLADKGQQFLANPAIAKTKFGEQVKEMMERATYVRAEKIAESGDHIKAAKEFEAFAGAFKSSELGSAARYKSAMSYEKGGDLVSAVRMHNMVLVGHSNDPKIKLAQNDSRNALARIYQQTGQLDLAAKQYQAYAAANPKDQKAINAYYNAGVLWESLGEEEEALASYQAYYNLSDRADRVEVLFNQAEVLRKAENFNKASGLYDLYLRAGPRNEASAIQASFYLAQIADKLGQEAKARTWYQKTVDMHKKTGKAGREGGVRYSAEARFELAQAILKQLLAIRFTASDKQQAEAAMQVKNLRERYINEMKEVIRYDNAPMIIAALASSGQMFDSLAQLFARIPAPSGFNAEEAQKYKELIQVQINGFKAEAKTSYKAALDKSLELESYTRWTNVAREGLLLHDPATVVDAGEVAVDARAADWMGL